MVKDGITDIMQLFGMSSQYSISAKNATALSNQLGETELTYVGHSLGGGLAELNSNITRREAITFNAAGVGVATKFINGMKNSDIKEDLRNKYNHYDKGKVSRDSGQYSKVE